jgi:hypothetical protein
MVKLWFLGFLFCKQYLKKHFDFDCTYTLKLQHLAFEIIPTLLSSDMKVIVFT